MLPIYMQRLYFSVVLDERVGNLTFVHSSSEAIPAVKSQVTWIVRGMYSNPPNHGARIVASVLNNPQLYQEWLVLFVENKTRLPPN